MTAEAKIETDVLVIGGGLAGTWAAAAAARQGARVIIAEKGYCGTSGVTATAGPGHWWVPPDPAEARPAAVRDRLQRAFGLAESAWMERIIDLTWRSLPTLAGHYTFSVDGKGQVLYRGLRGPEYMRAMRRLVTSLGVTVLDQSPAIELLTDADGVVAGARLHQRQLDQDLTVAAGAVVMATGGCAFKSDLLGSGNNTGDGYLMAAEVGADLSGMEFTNYYTMAPKRSNMARSMAYSFARYFDADGHELNIPRGPDVTRPLARALLAGPVFCQLDLVPEDVRAVMPQVQPNFVVPFARWGIDPYRDRFEVTLHGEGTVRGIGGIDIVGEACDTTVPGLYAAGDAATRELIAGATSGGGAQNSAWALSSGQWAGQGAAAWARARRVSDEQLRQAGWVGLRPRQARRDVDAASVDAIVRDTMLSFDKVLFRTGEVLAQSGARLENAWDEIANHAQASGRDVPRLRETAAILVSARWTNASALARAETRGMHHRTDAPQANPQLAARQIVGGLDHVWTRFRAPALREIAA